MLHLELNSFKYASSCCKDSFQNRDKFTTGWITAQRVQLLLSDKCLYPSINKRLQFVFCGLHQLPFKCPSAKVSADRLIGRGFKIGTLLLDYFGWERWGEEVGRFLNPAPPPPPPLIQYEKPSVFAVCLYI